MKPTNTAMRRLVSGLSISALVAATENRISDTPPTIIEHNDWMDIDNTLFPKRPALSPAKRLLMKQQENLKSKLMGKV